MIYEGIQPEKENRRNSSWHIPVLLSMAMATSIDAIVVGVSFAFIPINIILAVILIAGITFLSAMIGMFLGEKASSRFGKKFEILGG